MCVLLLRGKALTLCPCDGHCSAVQDCLNELGRWAREPGSDTVSLPYVHKHLGHAYWRKGDAAKAIQVLRVAIEHKRDYRQVR